MSNIFCDTCQEVNNVPKCVQELVIGSVAETDTEVIVYFTDARERVTAKTTTTDSNGLITLDTSDIEFIGEMQYNVSVIASSASNIDDNLMITDNDSSSTADCLLFEVVTVKGADGNVVVYPTQTLTFVS